MADLTNLVLPVIIVLHEMALLNVFRVHSYCMRAIMICSYSPRLQSPVFMFYFFKKSVVSWDVLLQTSLIMEEL